MAPKLFVVVAAVTALLAIQVKAQSPDDVPAVPEGPTFEQVVADRHAKTLAVVHVLVAKSTAPDELKEAVLLQANAQLEECGQLAKVPETQKLYFACTGQVIKAASDTLSAATASSGASSSVN